MFESLQDGLSSALKGLAGKAKLTEGNMREGLREVQTALLEADVSFPVVKEFMDRVSEQALGQQVLKSLRPAEHVVGIVRDELINLMGPVDHSLHLKPGKTVLMLCGLQGSGKTTTCAKLARRIQKQGKIPGLVAADLQRPAAIEQLRVLGEQLGVPVYIEDGATDPVKVCQNAVKSLEGKGAEVIILDTAGRLHIDDELMQQLTRIDNRLQPDQVYLVVDGMTGQDAVNSAKAFNEALELDGCIMTKLDGDARGGAALSVKAVTGVPLKYMGVGEGIEDLEEFHPDRMAGRILGMGDIVGLFEKAQQELDQEEMAEQQRRMEEGKFTLDDFRKAMQQITKLGPMQKVMGMIPGMPNMKDMMEAQGVDPNQDMKRLFGMIDSMTPDERRNPKLIDQSRRRRIAAGSGVQPHEINALVKQFDSMAGFMQMMANQSPLEKMKTIRQLSQGGFMDPGGPGLGKPKQSTGTRLSNQQKKQNKKQREKMLRDLKKQKRKGKR